MGNCDSRPALSSVPSLAHVDGMISDGFRRAMVTKLAWEFEKKRNTGEAERPALKIEVERLLHEYLIFIWLRKLNPTERITPSKRVDEAWHQHILFTREYARFCRYHLGEFLHHNPTVPNYSKANYNDDSRDYARVLIRYAYHTKLAPPVDFWPTSDREKAVVKREQETAIVMGGRVVFLDASKVSNRTGGGIAVAMKKSKQEEITDSSGAVIFYPGAGCGSM